MKISYFFSRHKRRLLALSVLTTSLAAMGCMARTPPSVPSAGVDAFVGSIGVNAHVLFGPPFTAWSDLDRVEDALRYLGVRHVRDGGRGLRPADVDKLARLARNLGVRYDFALGSGGVIDIPATMADLHRLLAAAPGSIAAVEGPNEINNVFFTKAWRITYAGQQTDICAHRYEAAAQGQAALFRAVHADPALRGVPVYNYSLVALKMRQPVNGCYADLSADLASLGSVAGKADFGNVHGYPYQGAPPRDALAKAVEAVRPAQGGSVVLTETGYATGDGPRGAYLAVSEAVQARYVLDALLDAFSLGAGEAGGARIARTYLYELLDDAPDDPPTDRERHFGLFRADGRPKPAATALHNLLTILRQPAARGAQMSRSGGGVPAFSLSQTSWRSDLDAHTYQLRLTQPGGGQFAIFWAEPPLWNPNARAEVPVGEPNHVTLKLARAANVAVYDPLRGEEPIERHGGATSVTFDLSDHPVVVLMR